MLGQVLGGMMGKVAVGRSIARAYGFVFGRIFTVLGLAWIGAVFYAGLALVMIHQIPDMQALHEAMLAGHAGVALWHVPVVLVSLLVVASIAIPLTREALDEGGEFVFAQFVLGARELRYFLALIRLGVILIAVLAAGALVTTETPAAAKLLAAHWPQLQPTLDRWPVVSGVQIGLCAVAGLIALVLALRFGFLLKAVAAVEHHASLRRAWALSRGNTLRILTVVVLTAIPAYLALFGIAYALLGQPLLEAYRQLFATGTAKQGAALLALYAAHGAAFAALAAFKMLLLVGLMAGAGAEAYRELTADEDGGAIGHAVAYDDHRDQEPAHHHLDHGQPESHAAEGVAHHEHEDGAFRRIDDGHASAGGYQTEFGHEVPNHDSQELVYAEPAHQEPTLGDQTAHTQADECPGLGAEPLPYTSGGATMLVQQSYEYQHDDDESCDCQIHAMPAHAHDDPHDLQAIVQEPEPVTSLSEPNTESERLSVLEHA